MATSRTFIKLASKSHVFWYRLTGGLIGSWAPGYRIMLVTTTGRRSGRAHTAPLPYLEDGGRMVVIGSNGGNPTHPDWWLNLKARPEATAQLGARRVTVRAEEATGDERERLWRTVTDRHPVYLGYEKQTRRRIPVVVLTPVE